MIFGRQHQRLLLSLDRLGDRFDLQAEVQRMLATL